jgi:16S rRNA (guanine527-N7)-methyltransferase
VSAGPAPALRQIGAALGLALSPTQVKQLERFEALLQRWNATHNLSAVREPAGIRVQHLADCLAVVPALERRAAELALPVTLLDVGSGGGLPGVVLAVLLPHWRVSTVDAVAKKVAFVRQAAGELQLPNLSAEHGRLHPRGRPGPTTAAGPLEGRSFGIVTARAFSSLAELVGLTRGLLAASGVWMALKGRRPDAEIADLPTDIDVFHVEPLAVPGLRAERCLVWMRPRRDSALS